MPFACPLAASKQQRAELVLRALAAAAEVVRQYEFAREYGPWVEAHSSQLDTAVVQYWQQAQQVRTCCLSVAMFVQQLHVSLQY
jgi:hypothetical protein